MLPLVGFTEDRSMNAKCFSACAALAIALIPMLEAQSYTATDLGVLPGGTYTIAQAINDYAAVGGYCVLSSDTERGFIWTSATGMHDLGTLSGDTDSYAQAINNSGQVAGV